MTKKHFLIITKTLSQFNPSKENLKELLELCKKENPVFDEERFLKACGINS